MVLGSRRSYLAGVGGAVCGAAIGLATGVFQQKLSDRLDRAANRVRQSSKTRSLLLHTIDIALNLISLALYVGCLIASCLVASRSR
jgi:ABC-type lipoprotein release transport system permease subunit